MYIDKNGLNSIRSASDNRDQIPMTEVVPDNSAGYAPISPETPSWGPPSDDPGYAPISPETPSWGPPSGNDPGYAPISPDTTSWGPPSEETGNNNGNSVIFVPGQNN